MDANLSTDELKDMLADLAVPRVGEVYTCPKSGQHVVLRVNDYVITACYGLFSTQLRAWKLLVADGSRLYVGFKAGVRDAGR